jgi:hypothetical protein
MEALSEKEGRLFNFLPNPLLYDIVISPALLP